MTFFWRRKPRNRRFERTEVLDVRLRAEPRKRSQRRLLIRALLWAVGTTVVALVAGSLWNQARERLILDSPWFTLKTIEIITDGDWVTPEQVRKWTGLVEGENLLRVDPVRLRGDLSVVPQIETVSVERVWPHLLRLRIHERKPVAQVEGLFSGDDGMLLPAVHYLDAQGMVMPQLPGRTLSEAKRRALAALPVIRGAANGDLADGRLLPAASPVRNALKLIGAFAQSPLAGRVQLESLGVAEPGILEITTTEGSTVTLSAGDFALPLRRWSVVCDAAQRLSRTIASLDLSVTNNCPVLWVEDLAAPPGPGKAVKPILNRKPREKHV
jgi:cell division septal protein FtsQ